MIQYIQRSRKKGAKQPPNTIYCGRRTVYGNPYSAIAQTDAIPGDNWVVFYNAPGARYVVKKHATKREALARAVEEYRKEIFPRLSPVELARLCSADYLSCWCKPGEPCHVQDVLIPMVNITWVCGCGWRGPFRETLECKVVGEDAIKLGCPDPNCNQICFPQNLLEVK